MVQRFIPFDKPWKYCFGSSGELPLHFNPPSDRPDFAIVHKSSGFVLRFGIPGKSCTLSEVDGCEAFPIFHRVDAKNSMLRHPVQKKQITILVGSLAIHRERSAICLI
jgi:hypothetical protein